MEVTGRLLVAGYLGACPSMFHWESWPSTAWTVRACEVWIMQFLAKIAVDEFKGVFAGEIQESFLFILIWRYWCCLRDRHGLFDIWFYGRLVDFLEIPSTNFESGESTTQRKCRYRGCWKKLGDNQKDFSRKLLPFCGFETTTKSEEAGSARDWDALAAVLDASESQGPIAVKSIAVRESQEPVVDNSDGEVAIQPPDEETTAGLAQKDFLNRVTASLEFIQNFRQRFSFHVFALESGYKGEVPYQDALALKELRWCCVLALASSWCRDQL